MRYCLRKISEASEEELELLSKAIRDRYEVLFPDWTVCSVSIKKSEDPNAQIDDMIQFLQNRKTSL